MLGPEATHVRNSVRDVKSALENLGNDYSNPSDPEELPAAFAEVLKHLPPVCDALACAKAQIEQRKDESTWAEVKDSMDQCKAKASSLESIYGKVVPSAAAQRMERYRNAVRGLGKGGRVEVLMEGILRDVKVLLTVDEGMKVAAEGHIRTLAEVMAQVSAIPPSLQDDGSASGIYNYGSGPQNVVTGEGQQYNNNNTGNQFNGSTFHGVDPFSHDRRGH
ncbi:hypothetical protein PG997_002671 [Apiospora hydei]|uniref:NACHT-NTPase and P-loop NTPases N-terminal domain-containing protein n=1 Tax=Apiospora hydei TaxID=1337664 RepID=A0ABR1WX29_9PEZI